MKPNFLLVAVVISTLLLTTTALNELVGEAVPKDTGRNFTEIITAKGYTVETHKVVTEDGYILTMFRIPHGKNGTSSNVPRHPVILQHGLLDSSFTWILNMPSQSLSYILADAGYDVWMGNSRGNIYSKAHVSLSPNDPAFWSFSWDEMARFDIPAIISYVKAKTSQPKIAYVGHSQGTTQMFAALSTQPELANSLTTFIAFGPVAFTGNLESAPLRLLAQLNTAQWLTLFGINDFLPSINKTTNPLVWALFEYFCWQCPQCCASVIELLCGQHQGAFNNSRMPVVATHEPGGTSVKNMQKWSQSILSGRFEMFDYGTKGNMEHYHQPTPPQYNISNIPSSLKIAMYSGGHDILADPADVQKLVKLLPTKDLFWKVLHDYAHLDFAWAIDARSRMYPEVIEQLRASFA